jgi:hypothetical protein
MNGWMTSRAAARDRARIDPRPAIERLLDRAIPGWSDDPHRDWIRGREAEIAVLSAGAWPCWEHIVERVPEFFGTAVVIDAVARQEWLLVGHPLRA